MLNFIRKLFRKEEKAEKLVIGIDDIEGWIDGRIKSFMYDADSKISSYIGRINSEKENIKESIEKLKSAELKNPNTPVREKQLRDGNRDAYIKKVESFLRELSFGKSDHAALKSLCSDFPAEIENFGKSTVRAYQVLQHFLANESRDVAIGIKRLENAVMELKDFLDKNGIEGIGRIKESAGLLKAIINKKKELEEALARERNMRQEIEKDKAGAEKSLEELWKSREFKEISEFLHKKKEISDTLNQHKDALIQSFSVLERSFKKYVRMVFEDEDVLAKYIEDPFNALLDDKELKILRLLRELEKNISNDKIELKDRKKGKTIDEIRRLDEGFFRKFVEVYKRLAGKLDEINKKINESSTISREKELSEMLEKLNQDIEIKNRSIDGLNRDIGKIDIGELKKSLQKEINAFFGTDISIS